MRKYLDKYQQAIRDNILVEFILEHKGRENVVSTDKIVEYLATKGYEMKPQTVRVTLAGLIMERHLPICSLNAHGYYWAKTKQDILDCIAHLQARMDSLQEHINHLKNFIME